ncbi:hypothetical protein [Variovorax paradoxus]|jgi:hypothetical protein|uniref:hypothetical protein n=1 Tax=Variovorax paradoxus TaxID=34073 RepID=UPI000B125ADE
MTTPDFFAQFFRDGWEVRCAVTRAAPGGNLSGRAEIVQGDQVRSTINSSGVYKTRLELAEALKKDAFRWITGQERDRRA